MRRVAIALLLAFAAACSKEHAARPKVVAKKKPIAPVTVGRADVGDVMPGYSTDYLNGKRFDLAAEKGNVVLLNLWATWCVRCRYEIPELQKLHDRYASRGFKVIGVSVDELRPVSAEVIRATVAAWIAAAGPPQPVATSLTVLRGVSPRQATIPLWLVAITLIIGISTMPLTLTEEREHRTLRALLVAPVSRWSLLIGKGGIGVAMIVAMTALTLVLNRTPIASPLPLALALLPHSRSSSSPGRSLSFRSGSRSAPSHLRRTRRARSPVCC